MNKVKKARINLNVYGVDGFKNFGNVPKKTTPKQFKNRGCCVLFVDDEYNAIDVDTFQGRNETYKKRDESLVTIVKKAKVIFEGTFEELCKKLSE